MFACLLFYVVDSTAQEMMIIGDLAVYYDGNKEQKRFQVTRSAGLQNENLSYFEMANFFSYFCTYTLYVTFPWLQVTV